MDPQHHMNNGPFTLYYIQAHDAQYLMYVLSIIYMSL